MAQTVPSPPRGDVIIVGGDRRQRTVCTYLADAGWRVTAVGLGTDLPSHTAIRWCESVDKALERTSSTYTDTPCALILPLPASRDGRTVWCPADPACSVTLEHVKELMERYPQLWLFGGCLPPAVNDRCVDYYQDESVQIRNAHLTAEAAIMLTMEQTDRALRGLAVAVIGYGRIGHILAHILTSVGASVTVCARRAESRAWAACEGCNTLPTTSITSLCHGFDVIYNTVPSFVLGRDVLVSMDSDTLILDLAEGASPEVIRECAERRGLRYVRAPSLPGRYAPVAAGRIIADAILSYMSDNQPKGGERV